MKRILFFTLACSMAFGSCKKGCDDMEAANFDSSVKKNDGSCTYESNLIIYWGQAVATFFVNDGAGNIEVYVDNVKIATVTPDTYWSGVTCETIDAIDLDVDLGANKNRFVNLKLIDDTGFTYYDVTLEIYPGCTTYEVE